MKSKLFLVFLLSAVLLSACGGNGIQGPMAVTLAHESDWVSAVEPRANGSYVVWMRYDSSSAYCTYDKAMADEADKLRVAGVRATFDYQTINVGAKDAAFLGSGCDHEKASGQTYRLVAISAADPKEEPKAEPK